MSDIIESVEEAEAIKLGETIDARVAAMPEAEKNMWIRVLFLLNQCDRYKEFVNNNYDIRALPDEETKTISVAVIEKPAVKQTEFKSGGAIQIDVQKSLKAQMYLKRAGCPNTAEVLKGVYEILTDTPMDQLVTSASESDIDAEIKAIKAAEKLKG